MFVTALSRKVLSYLVTRTGACSRMELVLLLTGELKSSAETTLSFFIPTERWPSTSPELNTLDYSVWAKICNTSSRRRLIYLCLFSCSICTYEGWHLRDDIISGYLFCRLLYFSILFIAGISFLRCHSPHVQMPQENKHVYESSSTARIAFVDSWIHYYYIWISFVCPISDLSYLVYLVPSMW